MSKRSEEVYPRMKGSDMTTFSLNKKNELRREGYEQAKKDTIAKIRGQVEKWMPDNPEGDEYTSGERVAFLSVLHLLKEMEEEL